MGYWVKMCIYIIICIIFVLKIFSILTKGRCKSNTCLIGKTALISGGNSGIGLEAAKALAGRGCRIIIADIADATKTKDEIIQETNNQNIIIKHCDLASFKSVRELAKDINATEERLDILINNAGIGSKNMVVTEDKLSKTLQVNYFSHFLLTHLLIDLLKKSAPSRIIFTSSLMAHLLTKLTIDDLSRITEDKDDTLINLGLGAYGKSKKLIIYATESLAEKLGNFGITVNCFHPGVVNSNIYQTAFKNERNYYVKFLEIIAILFGKNNEEGAQPLLHLALDKQVQNVSGQFFVDCKRFYKPLGMDRQFREDIWNLSEKLVKLEEHEKIK